MMYSISLIIPAYNEEKRLSPTLQSIGQWMQEPHGEIMIDEILIVDDGSTDATRNVALSPQELPVHTISFPRNRGKGAAIKAGIQNATSEWVLLFDADSATPIGELVMLIEEQKKSGAPIVIGSRMMDPSFPATMSLKRKCIGRIYHVLTAPLIPGIRDASCGFKLIRTDIAVSLFQHVQTDGYGYDVEFLALAHHRNIPIEEVQVRWTAIPGSKVHVIRDGLRMFLSASALYRRLLFPDKKGTKIPR